MMNKIVSTTLLTFIVIAFFTATVNAQTKIVFQIDLSEQIKDSTFVPTQHTIELRGNQLPFSRTRTIPLRRKSPPEDSLYATTVRFPSIVNGELLRYSYLIKNGRESIDEPSDRLLQLEGDNRTLPLHYFGIFAR